MPQEISFLQVDPADLRLPLEASVNPQTGEAVTSIGIPLTSGRNGFQPTLNLTYSSGDGNSVFGMGWNLQGIPVIGLSLKDGYPKYDGTDKFTFSGQELIPWLEEVAGEWQLRTSENAEFFIRYFRPATDTSFTRFEQWKDKTSLKIHWRVHGTNNTIMVFGSNPDDSTKIVDGDNSDKIFQWLLEAQYDNLGNAIQYEYKDDDFVNVDGSSSYERNRVFKERTNSQKYLKRIRYGNEIPEFASSSPTIPQNWLFEILFDYNDQEKIDLPFYNTIPDNWSTRPDPFSSYIAGFEQRTYRLCERILMFHNFSELGTGSTLIGKTKLNHERKVQGTTLNSIEYTGFKRTSLGEYEHKSFPPINFHYTISEVNNSFQQAPEQSKSNVPIGLNGMNYKWTDLYGEGLAGILYESKEAWYYKPNLGNGNLGVQQKVVQKPNSNFGSYALSDFDGDGNLNLVVLQGKESGYFEYDRDREEWDGFRSFNHVPSIRQLDINTQLIDLTGDGRSDIVTMEEDRTIWYPSKGKEGFDKSLQLAKPISNGVSRTPTIGSNPMLDYFFADMNGSGLPDQVNIYNGRVEYWPNMGNGKFGSGIVMENSPQLDFDFELDASRMRLVDLDGSGSSDLIYIGRGEITYWINAFGNQFLEGITLKGLPFIDNISSVQIIDFLGDGTPCLVWSSALAMHTDAPIHYLKLTNGIKPRLLTSVVNNMGLETRFHYGYSGQHYLRDKFSDNPWMTKLPSHRIVVDKLETIDHIGKTHFNQLFEFHDGFFDGGERAFRGFCLVDQYDSEVYQGTSRIPEISFSDPVCVRTWYHNGAPGWQNSRAENYYEHDHSGRQLSDYSFEENDLGPDEFFDAIRGLAGQVIRTETYGLLPEGTRKEHPFQVTHANYAIKKLQPRQNERYKASFAVFPRESLEINFEEDPSDPHITHSLNLEIDDYGIPIKQVSIAYPRAHADAKPEQQVYHLTAGQTNVVHFDANNRYEIGIPLESKSFQIQNDTHPPIGTLYKFSDLLEVLNETIATPIAFNEFFALDRQAKLEQWNKNFFWDNTQSEVLPWGEVGNKILMHHQEVACFNTEFLEDALGSNFSPSLIGEGGYISRDSVWWQPSATIHYNNRSNFYLPLREVQPNEAFIEYEYNDYHFALVQSTVVLVDEVGTELARNSTTAQIDYNVMAPYQITDANRNTSEVYYDPLGVVTRSSLHGQLLSPSGSLQLQGNGQLGDYETPSIVNFERILEAPQDFLQECASFFYYELDTWEVNELPLRSIAIAREEWTHDVEGIYRPESRNQVNIAYQDGFARTIQSKTLVEPGPDTLQYAGDIIVLGPDGEPELADSDQNRWQVSGHVVYNNKQEVVQQYEPYFSPIVAFETDEVIATFGQSGLIEYDAIGRQKRINLADGTYTKVEFKPWYGRQFDANDTIVDSPYDNINSTILPSDSPEGIALAKSKIHNDTPVVSYLDGLGRVFQIEESDENGRVRSSRTIYDALGNPKEIIDARGLTAFRYFYDMQGRVFHEISMDSGPKWQFLNALDQSTHLWDARNVHQQVFYDSWGRITQKQVDGALAMEHITERFIYGEDASISNPWQKNLSGQLVESYDQAGLTHIHRLDILGNILEKDRRLVEDYKSIPDWSDIGSVIWMSDPPFESKAIYDALGRPVRQEFPDETIRENTYLQSGALDQLLLTTVDGSIVKRPIVEDQIFNARGQLKESILGNGVIQQYEYDVSNYRLKQKRSFRRSTATLSAKQYQHINYTYDAVGNITHLMDTARPNSTLLYSQPRINQYTYDAFYQLTEAEGRTHQAMEHTDYAHAPDAPGLIKGTRHISTSNMNLVRTYTRRYNYDLNGNMEAMIHNSGTSPASTSRWRRDFWISTNSNRSIERNNLAGIPISNPEARFDANGNLSQLSHLRSIRWNYLNQLGEAVLIERPGSENDSEHYVYGGDGQRVRKVTQRLDSGSLEITEKIYLDGCEIKRVTQGANLLLERYTSYLRDGSQRIALMHRWTRDTLRRETDNISQKKMHYQLSCHLGSSAFELDAQGEIINYEEYFAFGGSAFVFGDSIRDVKLKEYRYSGKERDDATGLYYYGFRYYAPWLSRWLNPDPIGPKDGLNVYQFVHNNPINEVDPYGLQSSATALDDEIEREWLNERESFSETGNGIIRNGVLWLLYDHPELGTVYDAVGVVEGDEDDLGIFPEGIPLSEEAFRAGFSTGTGPTEESGINPQENGSITSGPNDDIESENSVTNQSDSGNNPLQRQDSEATPNGNPSTSTEEEPLGPGGISSSASEDQTVASNGNYNVGRPSQHPGPTEPWLGGMQVPWDNSRPNPSEPPDLNPVVEFGIELVVWIGLTLAGAVYAVAIGVVELALMIIDFVGLAIDVFSLVFTGDTLIDYEPLSALGRYVNDRSSGTTGDVYAQMAEGILRTPERIIDAALEGDPFSLGMESMNMILMVEGGMGAVRGLSRMGRSAAGRVGFTTGTQRLEAAISEMGGTPADLRLRSIQIEADLLNYDGPGAISDRGAESLTVAVAEGYNPITGEQATAVNANSHGATSLLERLEILHPNEVLVSPVSLIERVPSPRGTKAIGYSRVRLPANLHHSEIAALRYLINNEMPIGRVATSRPGCPSCQVNIAADFPGFVHVNPELFRLLTQKGTLRSYVRWLQRINESWFDGSWAVTGWFN